jgi:hypothetical protein
MKSREKTTPSLLLEKQRRELQGFVLCVVIASFLMAPLGFGQIEGATLGFTTDLDGSAIRPIPGVPGAAIVGDRVEFESQFRGAVVSSGQNYAISVGMGNQQVQWIDLTTENPIIRPIDGTRPNPDSILLSASGTAAGIYYDEAKTVQMIWGLPGSPVVMHEFDTAGIPGRATMMAVSDDGGFALIKSVDGDNVTAWVFDPSGASWPLPLDRPSAAAFFPAHSGNGRDAIVTDDATQTAYWIRDLGGSAIRVPVITVDSDRSFSSVVVSEDSRRAFLADDYGTVATLDLQTHFAGWANCACHPLGFDRLKGNSIYGLKGPTGEPMKALDASLPEPRILTIPSKPQTGPGPR